MLAIIKLALRISGTAFDNEIQLNIDACLEEMRGLGVIIQQETDGTPSSMQVQSAVIAYCKWQFGYNDQAERWEAIYHEKLAQLKHMTGFTEWEA